MKMDRTFTIEEVTFTLDVIPPMEAFEICELIREAISRPQDLMTLSEGADSPQEAAKRIIPGMVASISREHFKGIYNSLFPYISFTTKENTASRTLANGQNQEAFAALDPFAIYEVIGRAIYVNFSGYITKLMHRLGISLSPNKGVNSQ